MEVTETLLPGVGMRYEFETEKRQRVGVIVYRDGTSEIIGFSGRDPDAARGYLASDTGKVYTMLAHASGRLD